MKSLTQIVKSLKPSEIRFIKKLYSSQPNGEEKKRLKLFEILLSGVETDEKASKILYNSSPNSAFSHIKARLKNDIFNFLLVQDSSKKDVSKIYQVELSCRKYVMQGEILLTRGLYSEAEKLLLKALKIAIDYELYLDILRIKTLLRTSIGYRSGIKEFDKHSHNLDYFITEFNNFSKAKEYYFRLLLPTLFKTNTKKEVLALSAKWSEELDGLNHENSSANFTFNYYLFKISHHNLYQEYKSSIEYAKKLIQLVPGTPSLNSSPNISGAHMVAASIYLNLKEYELSIEEAKIAVKKFRKGMINELRAQEVLFFGYLRNKDFEKASEIIEYALKHKQIKSNKLLKARWYYFEANLEYITGNKAQAFKLLRKNNDLLKDKSGWLIGFKLLEMMLTIEDKDWFLLGYQLNNFNQLLGRQQKANVNRAKIIGQLIRSLLSNGGFFNVTIEKSADKLKLLEDGMADFYWDPIGYEVIRFDKWLKSKVKLTSKASF